MKNLVYSCNVYITANKPMSDTEIEDIVDKFDKCNIEDCIEYEVSYAISDMDLPEGVRLKVVVNA